MANEFLIRKWKACFRGNDINKDNVLTMEDAELFTDRFAAHHKFDQKQTIEVKEKFRRYWKDFFLRGHEKITEEMYIDIQKYEYNADSGKFREHVKKYLDIIADIFDVNKDGYLSENELEACVKAWGIGTFDKGFIQMFPNRRPGHVDMKDYVECWIEFHCNADEGDNTLEKPAMYGFCMLDG